MHTPDVQAAARVLEDVIRTELPTLRFSTTWLTACSPSAAAYEMRDLLFALIPHAGWVNLQLADGALLPNPSGLHRGQPARRSATSRSTRPSARDRIRCGDAVRAQIDRSGAG